MTANLHLLFRYRARLWLAIWLLTFSALCRAADAPAEPQSASERPGQLVFGVYAHIRSTELFKKMEPLQRHLQQALAAKGVETEITLRLFASYGDAIEALVEGEVDFVRFGPVSYVLAKERNPSIRLLAMESNDGKKSFNGVISVPADSPIRSVEDLRGKRIAFGNRRSTTGRYLAQAALVKAGIRARDLAGYAYLGRHDKVAFAVSSGNYDAGASNENTFHKYAQEKKLRKILEFPCVTKPWAARSDLSEPVFRALRDILLELQSPEVLYTVNRSGFLPASDSDYDLIRHAMALAKDFDDESVTVAVYTSEKPSEVYRMVRPMLDRLQQDLSGQGDFEGFHIKVFRTYGEAIDALVRGDIDIGRFGPASYSLAKEMNPHVRPLAMEDDDRNPDGLFVIPADSPVASLGELKGKTFAFGNRHSTSGRYLAQARLLEAGVLASDLKSYSYLGRHDRVAFAVAAGNYDAGVLRGSVLEKYAVADRLRVIDRFTVPHKVWIAREGIDDDLFEELQRGLLALDDKKALSRLGIGGFQKMDEQEYEPVSEAIRLAPRFDQRP